MPGVDAWPSKAKRERNIVIGGSIDLISRSPDFQACGRGFESCTGHTFSYLVYSSNLYVKYKIMKLG